MKKMQYCVISAEDGDMFWQPGIEGNCITIKASPWNLEKTNHTIFLHELPPGGMIREHLHQVEEEIFICLEGEAIITINGKEHLFKKHDLAFIAPLIRHSISVTSNIPLKIMVIISPSGLEERLKLMGKPKVNPNEQAPKAFDSDLGRVNSHGVL